jgi:hypothetical protein
MSLATLRKRFEELRNAIDPPLGACQVLVGAFDAVRSGQGIDPWLKRAPNAKVAAFLTGFAARIDAARALAAADELEDAQGGEV